MPDFGDGRNIAALQKLIRHYQAKVSIFDPTYKVFGFGDGISPASLFSMGPALGSIADACLDVGCTPVFVHHSRRDMGVGRPMELTDLLYAGMPELARQWLLFSRQEVFDPTNPGRHRLLMNYGGSLGHCGLKLLHVEEGVPQARKWDVKVMDPPAERPKTGGRARTRGRGAGEHAAAVLTVVQKLGQGGAEVPRKKIQGELPGMSGKVLSAALRSLAAAGTIRVEERPFKTRGGRDGTAHVVVLASTGG
jgi:hypothetical protein